MNTDSRLGNLEKIVNNFIENNFLKFPEEPIVNQLNTKLSDQIYKILVSGKYRKYPITEEIKYMLETKIEIILKKDLDFLFVPSFGGYKHSWCPTYPTIDWAEFFNISCFYDYLIPLKILTGKKIHVEYLSKDIIVPKMNNIPQKCVETYVNDFKKLLLLINDKQKDIIMCLKSSHEDYNINELFGLMEKEKLNVISEFEQLSFEDQQKRLSKSNNNICWDGIEDYTNLSEIQKNKIILNSRIINETFLRVDSNLRGGSAANRENAIPILRYVLICALALLLLLHFG